MKGKKTGGRQKGTPNKTTSQLRDVIAAQWMHYHESGQFAADMEMLNPHDRAMLMEKYATYLAPKMKSVDMDMTVNDSSETIIDRLKALTQEEEDQ